MGLLALTLVGWGARLTAPLLAVEVEAAGTAASEYSTLSALRENNTARKEAAEAEGED